MQSDPSARPTRIVRDAETRTLRIPWADGHESVYGWEALRRACPCATCQGEWGRPGNMSAETLLTVDLKGEDVQRTFAAMIENDVAMTSTLAIYELVVPGRPAEIEPVSVLERSSEARRR